MKGCRLLFVEDQIIIRFYAYGHIDVCLRSFDTCKITANNNNFAILQMEVIAGVLGNCTNVLLLARKSKEILRFPPLHLCYS